jgi:hypothetical protein
MTSREIHVALLERGRNVTLRDVKRAIGDDGDD